MRRTTGGTNGRRVVPLTTEKAKPNLVYRVRCELGSSSVFFAILRFSSLYKLHTQIHVGHVAVHFVHEPLAWMIGRPFPVHATLILLNISLYMEA